MRTITKTVEAYKYDELSDQAKEKAIEHFSDINVDHDWWSGSCEDAKNIGLKITSFDLDRNRHAEGNFIIDAENCAKAIIKEHGKDCETYKTAKAYLKEYKTAFDAMEKAEDGEVLHYQDEQTLQDINNEFLKSLLEDYSIMLQKESEYLTRQEAIEETIRANEYEFTKDGKFPAI
jgi:hypothetical protein